MTGYQRISLQGRRSAKMHGIRVFAVGIQTGRLRRARRHQLDLVVLDLELMDSFAGDATTL